MQQIFNLQLHLTPLAFVLFVFTDLLSNTETYFNIINFFTWLSIARIYANSGDG